MLRSILFGSSSLSGTKGPSTATVGHLWGVKYVTPGAIAFVSVLVSPLFQGRFLNNYFNLFCAQAIFLHSADALFEGTGSKSLIPYKKLFSTYKKIIVTKLVSQEKDSDFVEMMKWYNSQVFDWFNPAKGKGRAGGDNSGSSGIDEVMNQMEDLDIEEGWNAEQIHSQPQAADAEVCYLFFSISHSTTRC
jgi:hypothetical protein